MQIIGVNGIHSHGANGTDKALADLQSLGHDVTDYDYPKRNTLTVWRKKNRWDDAAGLLSVTENGDHVVAHSYGCLIVLEAMLMGAEFGQVFFFAAAASSDKRPWFPLLPRACEKLYVIYNPEDKALKWGSRIPLHPFGKLGYKGYRGPHDKRIVNLPALIDDKGINHNEHLDDARRAVWVRFVDKMITNNSQ